MPGGWREGRPGGSPRAGPPDLDPVPRALTSHALSLPQQSELSSCLSSPPTGLGWADKELMNEEQGQAGAREETQAIY